MANISENLLALNETKQDIKKAIENKGQDLTNIPFTQYADKIDAIESGSSENALKYIGTTSELFRDVEFPIDYEGVLEVNINTDRASLYNTFYKSKNIKSIKLINKGDKDIAIWGQSSFREISTLEKVDLTEFNRKFTIVSWFALSCSKLKSIYGALDLSQCTGATNWLNGTDWSLEDIEFVPNTIGMSIEFYWCRKLSKASIISVINGLSSDTDGLSVNINEGSVKKAFETSEGANDGDTSPEWNSLVSTKTNWNIILYKW